MVQVGDQKMSTSIVKALIPYLLVMSIVCRHSLDVVKSYVDSEVVLICCKSPSSTSIMMLVTHACMWD